MTPLRVRVTTTMDGTVALDWLSTYLSLAVHLYRGKVDLEKQPPDLVVLLTFPRKESGESFVSLIERMHQFPLMGSDGPVFEVEEA